MHTPQIQRDLFFQVCYVQARTLRLGDNLSHSRGDGPGAAVPMDEFLDAGYHLFRELITIGPENLDPVVLQGIVGSGNHDSPRTVQGLSQKSHPGGGYHTNQEGIKPRGGYARHHRAFQHLTGKARVAAYHNGLGGLLPEDQGRRPPDAQRQLRCEFTVGHAAHSVCAKILAHAHSSSTSAGSACSSSTVILGGSISSPERPRPWASRALTGKELPGSISAPICT